MSPVTVVTVGETGDDLMELFATLRGPVRVVRRCPELAQLLATCQSGLAQVAVVAGDTTGLTATLVDRLTAVGVSVVAVAGTPAEAQRLREIGAWPLTAAPTVELLTEAVLHVVTARRHHSLASYSFPLSDTSSPLGQQDTGSKDNALVDEEALSGQDPIDEPSTATDTSTESAVPIFSTSDGGQTGVHPTTDRRPNSGLPHHQQTPQVPSADTRARLGARARLGPKPRTGNVATSKRSPWEILRGGRGDGRRSGGVAGAVPPESPPGHGTATMPRTVAVWGPVGSPGRTLLAVNLAGELAAQGHRVLLVDADSYGASVAASLGLMDESASFAQACRVADQGLLTVPELARICSEVVCGGGTFLLLTGLTRSDRWPELRAAAVQRVLQTALSLVDTVVIDCGFSLETDEELSYDTVAPRRNAATLAALAQADTVFAVGSADAIGMPRLVRALAELPGTCAGADIQVVLNKVRKKVAGGTSVKALEDAWKRFGPALPISHVLPWDPDVPARALREGRLLQELAPDAALRRAIRDICCAPVQGSKRTAVSNATARP